MPYNKYFSLMMAFQRSKHLALNDIYLLVLTIYIIIMIAQREV